MSTLLPYESVSTIVIPEPPQMEYKYILVSYILSQQSVRISDLSEPGNPTTSFSIILKQGWKPLRESRLSGGGDTTGMAVLILLERVWIPVSSLSKKSKKNA
jgi:hypothetical protein